MAALATFEFTRINGKHYTVASQSREGIIYELTYNAVYGRWTCNCPDTTKNHNPRCKHVRALVAEITAQMQAARVQREATAIAEENDLQAKLEALQEQVNQLEAKIYELQLTKSDKRKRQPKNHTPQEAMEAEKAASESYPVLSSCQPFSFMR